MGGRLFDLLLLSLAHVLRRGCILLRYNNSTSTSGPFLIPLRNPGLGPYWSRTPVTKPGSISSLTICSSWFLLS